MALFNVILTKSRPPSIASRISNTQKPNPAEPPPPQQLIPIKPSKNDKAYRRETSKTFLRLSARFYLAVRTKRQWRPSRGPDNGSLLSGRLPSEEPLSGPVYVEAENPPEGPTDDLRLASRSSLLEVTFFSPLTDFPIRFIFFLKRPRDPRQNSSLMGRLPAGYACCFFERARGSPGTSLPV